MTERDDDIIEFDFFDDEPDTEQATQRRPAVRQQPGGRPPTGGGPRRPTFRGPEGLAPLLRLILLVALGIFLVTVLVFWIQSCRDAGRTEAYRDYASQMKTVSDASTAIGRDLNEQLTTPGTNQADLIRAIEGLTDRQEQVVRNAQDIDEPGPLRDAHRAAVESLQFRVSGLNGLVAAFRQTADSQDAARAGTLLAAQAERFVASDVIWDDLFVEPSKTELEQLGVTGVAVPDSNFVVTARPCEPAFDGRALAAASGRGRGRHADRPARHRNRLDDRAARGRAAVDRRGDRRRGHERPRLPRRDPEQRRLPGGRRQGQR